MWTALFLLGLVGLCQSDGLDGLCSQFPHLSVCPSDRASWGYQAGVNGPDTWAATFGAAAAEPGFCDGSRQSPIDLDSSIAVSMSPGEISMIGYDVAMEGEATNNGHALVYTLTAGVTPPYIEGGRLPAGEKFEFLQLHWHWGSSSSQGSEHTMDGVAAPMEIHLVHWNTKYADVGTALTMGDGLAVVGVFYEVDTVDNANLSGILSLVSAMKRRQKQKAKGKGKRKGPGRVLAPGGASATVPSSLKLDDLLPVDRADYYYYEGSLTTPSCNEVVLWTNLKSTVKVSEAQLDVFRSLIDSDGLAMVDNFRPPLPLNTARRGRQAGGRMLFTTAVAASAAADPLAETLAGLFNTGLTAALITAIVSIIAPSAVPAQARAQGLHGQGQARDGFEAEQHLRHGQRQWWQ